MQTISVNIAATSDDEKIWIDEQLVKYNMQFLPVSRDEYVIPLAFNIKIGTHIVAGVNAFLLAKATVFVTILWVDEKHRGENYGSILLKYLEDQAKEHGATLIYLDTDDYQARGFYIKQGYEEFGTLKNAPRPGHTKFFMKKDI